MPWLTQQINYSKNIIDAEKTIEMLFIGDKVTPAGLFPRDGAILLKPLKISIVLINCFIF
jgi:hypothetical protein